MDNREIQVRVPCPTCGGTGQGIPLPALHGNPPMYMGCPACHGSGAQSHEWLSLRAFGDLLAKQMVDSVRMHSDGRR